RILTLTLSNRFAPGPPMEAEREQLSDDVRYSASGRRSSIPGSAHETLSIGKSLQRAAFAARRLI
ncbi:MAG TPA: hypothetical protein VME24_00150, partial [Alphaproteobacteria bacterium]|nr:hypothetical protein [Alphaproteobacteria bacterium]